ncbi:MAG: hypothetical protein WEC73_01070, partial [Chthoniobacterales bacterium]
MNKLTAPRKIALLLMASAVFAAHPAAADPAQAEDVAYRMAKTYIDRSFVIAPTDNFGLVGQGGVIQFFVPVNRGLDYVFLAGTDGMARDVDIYVYDEVGNLILDDRRRQKNAGVQFRSSYNGTAIVYLHMAGAEGIASWCVLVGRRGAEKASLQAGLPGGGAAPSPTPFLTPSPTPQDPSLSATGAPGKLSTVSGTASEPRSFTVKGNALRGAVRLNAPAGVQVSKDGVDYSRSLSIQPSDGGLGDTTIMVRLDPGAQPIDELTGDIVVE